jgi:hypothetical protein
MLFKLVDLAIGLQKPQMDKAQCFGSKAVKSLGVVDVGGEL